MSNTTKSWCAFVVLTVVILGCGRGPQPESEQGPRAGDTRIIENYNGTYGVEFYRTDPHWEKDDAERTLEEAKRLRQQMHGAIVVPDEPIGGDND
jgi:hypothetical protein